MAEQNGAQSVYVVQRKDTYEDASSWTDVTTVKAAPRTRRRTILERALEGQEVVEGLYRVLDVESARGLPVELEELPPRLRIG